MARELLQSQKIKSHIGFLVVKTFLYGGAIASLLAVAPASANPLTILDTTLDVSYSGFSPASYSAPGFAGPYTGDYLSSGFDTQKLVATVGVKSLELTYYTKFDGSNSGAKYADIFLAPAANATTAPSSWAYGLSLGFQGGEPTGIYSLSGPANYLTSQQIWGPKGSGFIYGGEYVAPDGSEDLVPVDVTGGSALAGWTLTTTVNNSGPGGYPYVVDVVLTAPSIPAFSSLFGATLDVLWGTADCANDAIFASIAKVPEPMSVSLFGAGLAGGIIAYRRRRKAKAA
jgi:hypothetical protein